MSKEITICQRPNSCGQEQGTEQLLKSINAAFDEWLKNEIKGHEGMANKD